MVLADVMREITVFSEGISNCSTEYNSNSDAYNAITFHFYTISFFFCSFYFYSCSSLLPLFFGLDVNVPLGKVRLFYLFPQS